MSYNATIRIKRSLWDDFKNKCNDDGSTATAEITKFIEIYLADGNYEADKEKLPASFISLKEAVVAEVSAEIIDRFSIMTDASTALIRAEINKLQSGNSETNSEIAENEALAKNGSPRNSQSVKDSIDISSDSQHSSNAIVADGKRRKTQGNKNGISKDDHPPANGSHGNPDGNQHHYQENQEITDRLYSDLELIDLEQLKVSRQAVGKWRNGKNRIPENIASRWQPSGKGWLNLTPVK